jgi:hypothetical protein
MLGVIFTQCFDIADRDIGTRSDLNFGSLIALGFKKGIFDIMADLGEDEVMRIMRAFDRERPGFPMPKGPIARYLDFPPTCWWMTWTACASSPSGGRRWRTRSAAARATRSCGNSKKARPIPPCAVS